MFGPKIKIDQTLYEKLKLVCEIQRIASPEELAEKVLGDYVEPILQQAGKGDLSAAEIDDIANKMKGLGYLE